MPSAHCIVFALALLAECNPLAASVVVGPSKLDEGRSDGDGLSLLLGDEPSDDLVTPRRLAVQDNRVWEEEGATRIIIISDNGPGGFSPRSHQLNSVLGRAFPVLASRRLDQTAADWVPQEGRPETDDNLPVRRRDLDVLRCMIGRVYRPCWQA